MKLRCQVCCKSGSGGSTASRRRGNRIRDHRSLNSIYYTKYYTAQRRFHKLNERRLALLSCTRKALLFTIVSNCSWQVSFFCTLYTLLPHEKVKFGPGQGSILFNCETVVLFLCLQFSCLTFYIAFLLSLSDIGQILKNPASRSLL